MKIQRVILLAALLSLLLVTQSPAKGLQMLQDGELDKAYAKGVTFLIDANTFLGGASSFTTPPRDYGPVALGETGGDTINLTRSILISGAAQQGAIGTVNAVGSAVNMPINLVVLINSTANGININNILSAINSAP